MEGGIYRCRRHPVRVSADLVVSPGRRSLTRRFINMRFGLRGVLNILLFEEHKIMSERKINNKLKVFRAMHNWTQEELARRVCVTRKTINTVEKGKYIPSTYLALKLAKVFQVPVEELFQLDSECATDNEPPV